MKHIQSSAAVICFLIMIFPLYWLFSSSLKTEASIFSRPPEIFPLHPTFDAYVSQLQQVTFDIMGSFKNSLLISFCTMVISVVLAVPAAYGLARFRLKGKNLIVFLFLVSQMLPQIFTLIPNFIIFKKIGIYNTYWAPILSNCTLAIPFSLMMMRTFFVGIPREIDEAARIDGCNAFQSFTRVMLPMSANGLAVTFVFSFLFGYQDMMYSLTYVTDSSMWPVTTGIYNVVGRYGIEWCRAMAFGCMAVVPVILIFVFMQKYIVQGLTAGAVKG
jgi:multiple sugar transport system permease protein